MTSTINIIVSKTEELVEERLLRAIQRQVDLNDHEIFAVGLSGGSLPSLLTRVLPKVRTDWRKWRFLFCDERLVPFSDPESTFGVYRKGLIASFPEISSDQFVTIDESLPQQQVAADYERRMHQVLGDRGLDLALLGMGPDGHTCSLFPGHALDVSLRHSSTPLIVFSQNSQSIALVTDSPKPPPVRITMTLAFLKKCSVAIFVALGESKAAVLRDILVEKKPLPAALVRSGSVLWLLDSGSARLLPTDIFSE